MHLFSLSLENFRNFTKLNLNFEKSVIAFIGPNAHGKTNILEAISLANFGKSLRTEKEKNLIQHGKDFFRVVAEAKNSNQKKIQLEIAATKAERKLKNLRISGKKTLASEFVGNLPLVEFQPTDLNLVLLAPQQRRRYLDALLCQTSHKYLKALVAYQKILKNRNALLARIAENLAQTTELEFWDAELAKFGSQIFLARTKVLQFLTKSLATNFKKITGDSKKFVLKLTDATEISPTEFADKLRKNWQKDLQLRATNFGPHRQDLIFLLENKLLAANGSRGEIRSAILALKFSELIFLENERQEKPLLLLDDIFSELDLKRQKNLLQMIAGQQTFLTTTKIENLDLLELPKEVIKL
jgi:DNA replication and repair protein RecF